MNETWVNAGPALWFYRATVLNVVDGDTVDLRVDLGFQFEFKSRYRLAGINADQVNDKDLAKRTGSGLPW